MLCLQIQICIIQQLKNRPFNIIFVKSTKRMYLCILFCLGETQLATFFYFDWDYPPIKNKL